MKKENIIKILSYLFLWAMFVGTIIEETNFLIIKDDTMLLEPGGIIHTGSGMLDTVLKIACWGISVMIGFHILKIFDRYKRYNN